MIEPVVLPPGDEPEEAVAVLITHPDAWECPEPEPATSRRRKTVGPDT